jgi:hypothetical protein
MFLSKCYFSLPSSSTMKLPRKFLSIQHIEHNLSEKRGLELLLSN